MTPSQPDSSDQRGRALTDFAARSREASRKTEPGVPSHTAWRREGLDRVAAETITALHDAGVEVLVLKGPALAQALYGPARERGYFDIDLLVSPEARSAVEQVLSQLGYRNVSRDQGIDDVAGILHAEMWARLDKEIGNVSVDLHWKLAGCAAPEERIWTVLRSGAQIIGIGGCPALTLSDAGLALHAALHLAQHGLTDAKATGDLRLALERWPPELWAHAAELAAELEALGAFSVGLALLPEGARMAGALGLRVDEGLRWDLDNRDSRPRGTFHVQALTDAKRFSHRLAIIRRALIPSPAWMRWEMRWSTHSPLHLAAAYLTHLARTPVWALRAVRFRLRQPR